MSTEQIITVVFSIVLGFGVFVITMMAIAKIAEAFNLYFGFPILAIIYVGLLAIGTFYWQPLSLIATAIIWALSLYLVLPVWLEERRERGEK